MTCDTVPASYTRNLLSQFNLFKYENSSIRSSKEYNSFGLSWFYLCMGIFILIVVTVSEVYNFLNKSNTFILKLCDFLQIFIIISNTSLFIQEKDTEWVVENENSSKYDNQQSNNIKNLIEILPKNFSQEIFIKEENYKQFDSKENISNNSNFNEDDELNTETEENMNEIDENNESNEVYFVTEDQIKHNLLKRDETLFTADDNNSSDNDLLADSSEYYSTNMTQYQLERENMKPKAEKYVQEISKVKFINSKYEHLQNQLKQQEQQQLPREHRLLSNDNNVRIFGIQNQIPKPPKLRKQYYTAKYRRQNMNSPRPFQFMLYGPAPSRFRKNKKPKVNSIQDILKQIENNDTKLSNVKGRYRRIKENDVSWPFRNTETSKKNKRYNRSRHYYATKASYQHDGDIEDPFYLYKPESPNDVNLLTMNSAEFTSSSSADSKFNDMTQVKPIHEQPVDLQDIYYRVVSTGNKKKIKTYHNNRKKKNSNIQNKPLSLMLDIYPIPEDEQLKHSTTTQKPNKNYPILYPITSPSFNFAANDIPYSFQLDNSYYDSMSFSQLQSNKYSRPNNNIHQNNLYDQRFNYDNDQEIRQNSKENHENENSNDIPTQIMVHLNLYPNKKPKQRKSNSKFEKFSSEYRNNENDEDYPEDISTITTTATKKDNIQSSILKSIEIELNPSFQNAMALKTNNNENSNLKIKDKLYKTQTECNMTNEKVNGQINGDVLKDMITTTAINNYWNKSTGRFNFPKNEMIDILNDDAIL